FEYLFDRVGGLDLALRGECHREQMQIVIAEHGDRVLAERSHETQRFERLRPAIHEVAGEPEAIAIRAESSLREQSSQLLMTTLNVADRPRRHFGVAATARCQASRAGRERWARRNARRHPPSSGSCPAWRRRVSRS